MSRCLVLKLHLLCRWLAKQDMGSPVGGGQGFQFESDVLINTKLPGQKEGGALCLSLEKHVCSQISWNFASWSCKSPLIVSGFGQGHW